MTTTHDVWCLAILKGGASKTTTAVMLAFARAMEEDVLLIDADPGTQGATEWMSEVAATNELPFDVAQWSRSDGGLLVPFVQRKQQECGASLVIIDCPSEGPHVVEQAMPLVMRGGYRSRVITPCAPENAELHRVAPTAAVVRGFAVRQSIALTRVPDPGRGASREARAMLTANGYHVLGVEVRQNTRLYADVFGQVPAGPLGLGSYADMAEELCAWPDVDQAGDELAAISAGAESAGVVLGAAR